MHGFFDGPIISWTVLCIIIVSFKVNQILHKKKQFISNVKIIKLLKTQKSCTCVESTTLSVMVCSSSVHVLGGERVAPSSRSFSSFSLSSIGLAVFWPCSRGGLVHSDRSSSTFTPPFIWPLRRLSKVWRCKNEFHDRKYISKRKKQTKRRTDTNYYFNAKNKNEWTRVKPKSGWTAAAVAAHGQQASNKRGQCVGMGTGGWGWEDGIGMEERGERNKVESMVRNGRSSE